MQYYDYCCYIGPAETHYFKKSVIGGKADTISWADNSFIIDISSDSFPKGHQVDILIHSDHSHQFEIPKGYKILSQTYHILASEKLHGPVNLTLEHNAVITTEEEAESLVILHRNDKGETENLYGHTEPYCAFITFQLKEFSDVAPAGPDDIETRCFLSFYRQKISDHYSNPHLEILALVSRSNTTHEVLIQL